MLKLKKARDEEVEEMLVRMSQLHERIPSEVDTLNLRQGIRTELELIWKSKVDGLLEQLEMARHLAMNLQREAYQMKSSMNRMKLEHDHEISVMKTGFEVKVNDW